MGDELKRRLVHASGTAVPVGYLVGERLGLLDWTAVQGFLLVCAAGAVALELIRLTVGLDWRIFEELTRSYEQDNLAGYALYLFGMTAVALVFSPQIAVPAMLMLTIADPISGLLGSGEMVKRTHVLFVTFGVCVFIASLFVPPLAAVLGATAATLADGVKPVVSGYVIDDNLTIPTGAATAMFLAIRYLPTAFP